MPAIPDAAIAVIAAALDDYRLTTPDDQQTPRQAAERAAEYLVSSGWGLHVPRPQPASQIRTPCPHCGLNQLVTREGRIRRHGAHASKCSGSGALVRTPA
ncbi:hypothetical protein [Streptomyces caniscabiei]|uniref:hypothetical protein n=1 Tax=Streptomyces caniscabiei TaxID=2746961 RepID=UPI0029ADAF56|nr:hypothetical protein [Streptomyces caniscabiei]MDX2954566.1 hypothetical protein [Streptomyces caniscabiei]